MSSLSSTRRPQVNGGVIKFYNMECKCGVKCAIRVSETKDNPNALFYACNTNKECGFIEWWAPRVDEDKIVSALLNNFKGIEEETLHFLGIKKKTLHLVDHKIGIMEAKLDGVLQRWMENERKDLDVLPQYVWELIIKKLDFVDYVRFSCVSKLCRSIAVAAKQSPGFSLRYTLPWLVLSSEDGPGWFLSVWYRKIFKLKLPKMDGSARCCGSSFGWLIMANKVEENFLLNPFSGLHIQLPSQTTLPIHWLFNLSREEERGPLYIRKAILTSPPTSSNCLVVAIYAGTKLCFCRPGDKAWSLFKWPKRQPPCADVRCYNGQLYAIDADFNLVVLELEGSHPRGTKISLHFPFHHIHYNYLVESLGGELLMVVRCRTFSPHLGGTPFPPPRTYRFVVFKLEELEAGPSWVKIKSIGDAILFVGTSGGFSISATTFSSSSGNCIYFTDDNYASLPACDKSSGCHDIGVFSLEDKRIRPLFPTDSHSSSCPPIWFLPC